LVSSKGEAADRMWGEEQGAKGYITKPYEPQQILDELKKFN
jgi:twitching motility two-component system response regulator PilH